MTDAPTLEFPADWIGQRGRKRLSDEEMVEDYGPLTDQHVEAVQAHMAAGMPALGIGNNPITTIRHTHHRLAQLLAIGGVTDEAAGRLCGYSPNRVYSLKQDPAFQELISYYERTRDEGFADAVTAMADLGIDLIQKFREYLEEQPEKLTPAIVLEGLKIVNDRAGLAPVSRSVNVNVNAGLGDRLRAGRQRAIEAELQITAVTDLGSG